MKPKLWSYLVALALIGVLLVSCTVVSLAEEGQTTSTPTTITTTEPPAPALQDPVTALADYLTTLGTDPATVDAVKQTLAAALAEEEGAQGVEVIIQGLLSEQASLDVVLRVADRLQLLMDGETNFGQVMKVFRLSLKEGKNAGIERALQNAERKLQKDLSDGPQSQAAKPEKTSGGGRDSAGREGSDRGPKGK